MYTCGQSINLPIVKSGSRRLSLQPTYSTRIHPCQTQRSPRLTRASAYPSGPRCPSTFAKHFSASPKGLSTAHHLAGLKVAHLSASPNEHPVNLTKFLTQVSRVTTLPARVVVPSRYNLKPSFTNLLPSLHSWIPSFKL